MGNELLANARLIAAAPELLEACQEALAFWHEGKEGMTQLQYHAGVDRVEGLLRAAIAKAEGGK